MTNKNLLHLRSRYEVVAAEQGTPEYDEIIGILSSTEKKETDSDKEDSEDDEEEKKKEKNSNEEKEKKKVFANTYRQLLPRGETVMMSVPDMTAFAAQQAAIHKKEIKQVSIP